MSLSIHRVVYTDTSVACSQDPALGEGTCTAKASRRFWIARAVLHRLLVVTGGDLADQGSQVVRKGTPEGPIASWRLTRLQEVGWQRLPGGMGQVHSPPGPMRLHLLCF